MGLAWFWLTAMAMAILAGSLVTLARRRKKKTGRLPPGPKGIPILGHLHMLGKNPHKDLQRIARDHGPIVYMQFGLVPHIVVSSPEAAELFLKTHDLVFASRPPLEALKYISWEQRSLTFGAYGPYWRNMRKLCILELLSTLKINSFRPMRQEELGLFVESLKEASRQHVAVDLSAKVSSLTAEMSCRMVFGKKYADEDIDERGFKTVVHELMNLAVVPNLADYFPFLAVLDLQGLTRKMKALAKVFDDFFERVIEDHVRAGDRPEQAKDIVDTMMSLMQSGEYEFQFDRRNVKAIMLDMLSASMDTTAASVDWILAELLRNPRVMKKVQKELEQVVGLKRMVEESDLDQLEYLDMVVKETFRLHPVAPLLITHLAREESKVNGYDIPKDSRIMVSMYAIGRDPNVWSDPEMFIPERFIGSDIDVKGQHFQLLPFGSGRRGCPGMQLGLIQVRLIVSQLIHCFDWQLPNDMSPQEVDMDEDFSLVLTRANHLMAIPTLRLQNFYVGEEEEEDEEDGETASRPKRDPYSGTSTHAGEESSPRPAQDCQRPWPDYVYAIRFVPNIIVSSPQAAELFLKTHDLVFASRPPHEASKYLSWDQRNLVFGAYSPYWRNMRKLCTLELLSTLKINSFQPMRREELGLFVESLKEASRLHATVDLSAKVVSLTAEMSCRMVFGKKYDDKDIDDRGFKAVIQETMKLGAVPNLGDYFPFLGVLDLQGLTRKMKSLAKVYDDFFDRVIEDHVRAGDRPEQAKDIVDTMMSIMQSGESEFQFDRRNIKAMMLDLLIGSMDTAAASVEWILSELLRNPTVMKKLQKELEQVVGLKRMVEESDLDQLEYLNMVVKETFRLHPVGPLLIPHYSREDSKVNGYDIPKGSRILINTYAIGRDPNVWTDPEMFVPERFSGSDIDVKGQHFQLLPFGSGRRGCPGIQLGLIQVRLIMSQLVHCFDWQLPNDMSPKELDMNEEFGLVVSRVNHLMAIPTLRLHN